MLSIIMTKIKIPIISNFLLCERTSFDSGVPLNNNKASTANKMERMNIQRQPAYVAIVPANSDANPVPHKSQMTKSSKLFAALLLRKID